MSYNASVAALSCFESGLSFSYSENSKVKEYNIRQLKVYTYSSLIPDLTPGVRYTEYIYSLSMTNLAPGVEIQ
jgi:hypothetical protein